MKPIVREHIQQLDVSLGGGIVSEKIRVDTIDNPILIIGLGGTGIDALLRLKYQINRRFKLPQDPVSKKRWRSPTTLNFWRSRQTNRIGRRNTEVSDLIRSTNLYCCPMPRLAGFCRIAVCWSRISRTGCPLS